MVRERKPEAQQSKCFSIKESGQTEAKESQEAVGRKQQRAEKDRANHARVKVKN